MSRIPKIYAYLDEKYLRLKSLLCKVCATMRVHANANDYFHVWN